MQPLAVGVVEGVGFIVGTVDPTSPLSFCTALSASLGVLQSRLERVRYWKPCLPNSATTEKEGTPGIDPWTREGGGRGLWGIADARCYLCLYSVGAGPTPAGCTVRIQWAVPNLRWLTKILRSTYV